MNLKLDFLKPSKDRAINYGPYYIPYGTFQVRGCVLHTSNSIIQKTWHVRGVDVDTLDNNVIDRISEQFNQAQMKFGTGYCMHYEVDRFEINDYTGSQFTGVAPFLQDYERAKTFSGGKHFSSAYYITFSYILPNDLNTRLQNMTLIHDDDEFSPYDQLVRDINRFVDHCQAALETMERAMEIHELTYDETMTYLHYCLSLKRHLVRSPENMNYLNYLLSDTVIENREVLMLDELCCPIVTFLTYPNKGYPELLEYLNTLKFEFRAVHRVIFADKEFGRKTLDEIARHFNGSKTPLVSDLSKRMNNGVDMTSGRQNLDAMDAENETDMAIIEQSRNESRSCYHTFTVMVWDEDYKRATSKAMQVVKVCQTVGFTAFIDKANSFEAYQGSLPGNMDSNSRRAIVSTKNTSHFVPLSSMWCGEGFNTLMHERSGNGAPLLTCPTDRGTPFHFNLNSVGDTLGMAWITGTPGTGKSVLESVLANAFTKYQGYRVIIMDYDRSARGITLCQEKATFYHPLREKCSFQPLRNIDEPGVFSWAIEFIYEILKQNGIEKVPPEMGIQISEALKIVATFPKEERTLSLFNHYCQYVQTIDGRPVFIIREILTDYLRGGTYGDMFDANESSIQEDDWICYEMRDLMECGDRILGPAIMYIHHVNDQMITKNRRPTLYLWDEMKMFLKCKFIPVIIDTIIRTYRKYWTHCVFATQSLQEVLDSEISEIIIQICKTKLFLSDPAANNPVVADMYRKLGLTEKEILIISRLKREIFFKSEKGARVFGLNLRKGSAQLAMANCRDQDFLDRIKEFSPHERLLAILKENGYDEIDNMEQLLQNYSDLDTRGVYA